MLPGSKAVSFSEVLVLPLEVSEEPKATMVKALISTMPKVNRFITPFLFMPPQPYPQLLWIPILTVKLQKRLFELFRNPSSYNIGHISGVKNHTE